MRRGYLDWLRGIAVLIMIEAHTLDSWTRVDERGHPAFGWAMVIAGFGAPIFLFLAGVALALATGSRVRKGLDDAEAAALARRRGWQIFALAFLFRLQSWLISGGPFWRSMLKVDILNIMGIGMLAAAVLWGIGRRNSVRALLLVAAAVAVTMLTPLVRSTALLAPLFDPVEWYLRPAPGRTTFTLFPWAGFLLAGGAIGLWLDAARGVREERITNLAFAGIGTVMALTAYTASFLPSIYPQSDFWTSSPSFFFLRLGILIGAVPIAYLWNVAWRGWSPLQDFGRASLFVYWIHVEMAYGVLSAPLHRNLRFPAAVTAYAAFCLFLFALVKLKDYFVSGGIRPVSASVPAGYMETAAAGSAGIVKNHPKTS